MFLSISKNGCTSLKHLLYIEEYGKKYIPLRGEGIHMVWGFQESAERIIDRNNAVVLAQYKDYTRFAVYRDPVEPFMSTFYNKVLYPPRPHVFLHNTQSRRDKPG